MRPPSYYNSIVKSNSNHYSATDFETAAGSGATSSRLLRSGLSSSSGSSYASRSHLPFVPQSTLVAHCFTGVGSSTRPSNSSASSSWRSGGTSASGSSSGGGGGGGYALSSRPPSTKLSHLSSSASSSGYSSSPPTSSPSGAYSSNSSSATSRGLSSYTPRSNYLATGSSANSSSSSSSSFFSASARPSYRPAYHVASYQPIRLRERPLLTQISNKLRAAASHSPELSADGRAPSKSAERAGSSLAIRGPGDESISPSPAPTPTPTPTPAGSANEDPEASWSSDITRNISRNKYLIKFREIDPKERGARPSLASVDVVATVQLPPEAEFKRDRGRESTVPDREPEGEQLEGPEVKEREPIRGLRRRSEQPLAQDEEKAGAAAAKGKEAPSERLAEDDAAQASKAEPKAEPKKLRRNVKLRVKPMARGAKKEAAQEASQTSEPIKAPEQPKDEPEAKSVPETPLSRAKEAANKAQEPVIVKKPEPVTEKPPVPATKKPAEPTTKKPLEGVTKKKPEPDAGKAPAAAKPAAPEMTKKPTEVDTKAAVGESKPTSLTLPNESPSKARLGEAPIKPLDKPSSEAAPSKAPANEQKSPEESKAKVLRVKKVIKTSKAGAEKVPAEKAPAEKAPVEKAPGGPQNEASGEAREAQAPTAPPPAAPVEQKTKVVKKKVKAKATGEATAEAAGEPTAEGQRKPRLKPKVRRDSADKTATSGAAGEQTRPEEAPDGRLGRPSEPGPVKKPERLRYRLYNVEDFNFLTVLGHGGWGFVMLAELKQHDLCFAVKCIKKITIVEDDDYESIMIERKMLALGNVHPFICKLFCTFETEGYLFFAMEYLAGGDLMFHVQREGKFTEPRCRFYAAEIICAIRFLHNRHIIYRDLKLDNILLDAGGHVRLVDFGMCQCRTYREEMLPSNFCGTPEYISPEIIKGVPYNHSVDWWSFGVLLYEMAVGKMPFRGNDENELLWNVCYEQIHYPMFLTKELTSLLKLLLEREPSKRMGMATCKAGDICDQPFFRPTDWKAVEELRVPPPFVPEVTSNRDVQNFDSDFTESTCELSPVDQSTLEKIDQKQFAKFPYTNPDFFLFDQPAARP